MSSVREVGTPSESHEELPAFHGTRPSSVRFTHGEATMSPMRPFISERPRWTSEAQKSPPIASTSGTAASGSMTIV